MLVAPVDDVAFCVSAQPTFEWAAVDQATSYLLRVVSPTQLYTAEVTATTHTFGAAFVELGNYAWSVTAAGGSCPGTSSEIRTFAVGDVPGATTLLAPADAAQLMNPRPTFEWQAVSGASTYRLLVDDEPTLAAPYLLDETVAVTTWTPAAPLTSGTRYWQVIASNACGVGVASAVRTFELLPGPPAPTPLSPADGARLYLEFGPVTFAWEPVGGALSYTLQIVGETQGLALALYEREESTTDTFLVLSDLPSGAYTWRVRTTGEFGTGPWSAAQALELAPFEPVQTLLLPIALRRSAVSERSIAGRVKVAGLPAAGMEVELRSSDGGDWATVDTATTGDNGWFEFGPVLPEGASAYYVRWANNSHDSTLLSIWECNTVSSTSDYPADYRFAVELRNVDLLGPAPGAEVTLPITFEWATRGDPDEDYELNLAEDDLEPYWYRRVGYMASQTLSALPAEFALDAGYLWWLWVYSDSGYGVSYYANPIRFGGAEGADAVVGDGGKSILDEREALPRHLSRGEDE